MGTTKLGQLGIKIDSFVIYFTSLFNPAKDLVAENYGRGLEQASGLGYWFIALTMAFGGGFGFHAETIAVNNLLWAWMAVLLGTCQIYYYGLLQRRIFNLMATAGWITIAISAYGELGGWNLLTAISLPYCLCSFYVYGFLLGEK